MRENIEQKLIERAQWRNKAKAKLTALGLQREDSQVLDGEIPLVNQKAFAYFIVDSKAFSKIDNSLLKPRDFENLEHLPMLTIAWILAMEDEGADITIDPRKQGRLSKQDYPFLHSIYLTIKLSDGQHLSVSPIYPWNERLANLGDVISKKEAV